MASYFCPRCGAVLSEDFLGAAAAQFRCPECNEPVQLAAVAPEWAAPHQGRGPSPDVEDFDTENAPGGRVLCRTTGPQMVIFVPPGSNKSTRSLGCCAFGCLGFLGLITAVTVAVGAAATMRAVFLGLFWAVALVMLYSWIWDRFGKLCVLVEPGRLVLKRELFGRERFKDYVLGDQSQARLIVVEEKDDPPLYLVSVFAENGDVVFGDFLTVEEKRWVVDRINRHLGRPNDGGWQHRQERGG